MAAASQRPGNVPAELASFVGRRVEIAEITRLFSTTRLVTLTGPAGVGKSRLALHIARRVQRVFADGVWLVELAQLRDPALVANTVAHALSIHDLASQDSQAQLGRFLQGPHLLLVLDNCEHLVQSCAELSRTLLNAAGDLRMLVTSRHVLDVLGEHVYYVRPFTVTTSGSPGPATDPPIRAEQPIRQDPAVELFAQRGAAVCPAFVLADDNRARVVDICGRLDGIPLAIELAAARLRSLDLEQLASRLDDRFRLLNQGLHGGLARQRTLRATLDWSHDLCSPAEQVMWARVAVFGGSFDLEAAEEVCAGGEIGRADVVDLLYRLVSKSVLNCEERDGVARYRMLDTLRDYGLAWLRSYGDEARVCQAHARRYLHLAQEGERRWFGPMQDHWLSAIRRDHDNLRSALDFLLDVEDADAALELITALWFHWIFSGRGAEGLLWVTRALALPSGSTRMRARGLWLAGFLASVQDALDRSAALCEEAQALADQLDDRSLQARMLQRMATVAVYGGDFARAQELLSEALARYELVGESDSSHAVLARLVLGWVLEQRGERLAATEYCLQAAEICRTHGDQVLLPLALTNLARISCARGELDQAAGLVREAIEQSYATSAPPSLAQAVELRALIAAAAGQHEQAAELLGAADRAWGAFDVRPILLPDLFRSGHGDVVASVRGALGAATFEAVFRRGSQLDVDQIVMALGRGVAGREVVRAGRESASDSDDGLWALLTPREREVARLVAQGLSNLDIAKTLVISRRTAESHVERILTKLGFTARAQVAAWATANPDSHRP